MSTAYEKRPRDPRAGLTLGELRDLVAMLDGAPHDLPVAAQVTVRGRLRRLTVTVEDQT